MDYAVAFRQNVKYHKTKHCAKKIIETMRSALRTLAVALCWLQSAAQETRQVLYFFRVQIRLV